MTKFTLSANTSADSGIGIIDIKRAAGNHISKGESII
jgi:hypothetical protein